MLLIGLPGSGKTHRVLEAVRERLRSGRAGFRLLVPTATMAEHLRNSLAREGFVFRPSLISTLAKFVQSTVEGISILSGARLDRLVADALADLGLQSFRSVADLTGFRAAAAATIEELSSAGYDAGQLRSALGTKAGPISSDFLTLYEEVERRAAKDGQVLRGKALKTAAATIRAKGPGKIDEVFFDGFLSFVEPEMEVIDALQQQGVHLTVTLPDWGGAVDCLERLVRMGLAETRCEHARPRTETVLVKAQTQDREVEEIAARILELAAGGRAFRDMCIVVRKSDPYVPALRAALERFGIPARFYFQEPLASHALVRYFAAAIEAALGGWDYDQTLAALRMTPGGLIGLPEMNRFDFEVREQSPGQGLDGLRKAARGAEIRALIDSLQAVDGWRTRAAIPAEWVARFKTLRSLFKAPEPVEPATHEQVALWQAASAASKAFQAVVEEMAKALPPDRLTLAEFWSGLKDALRLTPLHVPDHRRNVVHVMEVHEARQWELPVVFVCGLLEKQFPVYHAEDPFLADELRIFLQRQGMRVASTVQKDQEEDFLFELAMTRATELLVLSYPQFNQKGEETLRSFYVDRLVESAPGLSEAAARAVRPKARGPRAPMPSAVIANELLRQVVAGRHAHTSPTALEVFLQCPFRFFAEQTLRLKEPPPAPEQRLDMGLQGTLVHEVLKRWLPARGSLRDVFEKVFDETCRREHIPEGYRTEAIRLELWRNLARFVREVDIPGARFAEAEQRYTLPLMDGVTLGCRVDRIDVLPDGRALIVDYKYSARERVIDLVKEHGEGLRIQGGLYMLALAHEQRPCAGMLFAALRERAGWAGWQTVEAQIGDSPRCSPEDLRRVMDASRATALDAIARIGQGVIDARPADGKMCEYCAFGDACRVESAGRVTAAGEAQEWA